MGDSQPNGTGGSATGGAAGQLPPSTGTGGTAIVEAGGSSSQPGAGGATAGGGSGGSSPGAGGSGGSTGSGGAAGTIDAGGVRADAGRTADAGGRGRDAAAGNPGLDAGSIGPGLIADAASVFAQCRFHFGAIDSTAKSNTSLLSQIDMFTSGWIGSSENFNLGGVCTETNPGAQFAGIVPNLVAYIIAFTARRDVGLADCNVSGSNNLCNGGATYIRAHLNDRIIPQYIKYAQGFAQACGTNRPMIWMMEPDYYQYSTGGDPMSLSAAEAGQIMHTIVSTVRQYLPKVVFSMDISPWIPNNGASWYSNFTMSDFTFISTSGGGTDAGTARIRAANAMTWAGVHQVTGKPILADTGYGAAGRPAGPDPDWDVPANVNARILDGVISITQYSPSTAWATTISGMRPQLSQCN